MPRGPAPNPNSRRRNKPTIVGTELPAEGRTGRVPAVPEPYKLGGAGRAFWKWAWKLPQATQWDEGARYFAVRRAQLEDDLAAMELVDHVDLEEMLGTDVDDIGERKKAIARLEFTLGALKRSAAGEVAVMKEMRELDNRLGLNPKALIDLRWTIGEKKPTVKKAAATRGKVARMDDYRDRLG